MRERLAARLAGTLALVAFGLPAPAGAQPALAQPFAGGPEIGRRIAVGDAVNGRRLVIARGCNACHVLKDIPGPYGRVGPDLGGLSGKSYLAGAIPNRPDSLVAWLLDPPRLVPQTAMPAMGLSAREAEDVARYLYGLKAD